MTAADAPITVEVWSDIVCPWCSIGKRRLQRAVALASEDRVEAPAVGLERAADIGITAVPTYVIDGQWTVPGAQDSDVFEQAFRRVAVRRSDPVDA